MSLTLEQCYQLVESLQIKVGELEARVKQNQQVFFDFEDQVKTENQNHPPIGSIIFLASENIPNDKYRLCDGRELSRETYKNLFLIIGVIWGAGDGSTTFNIPDLRGVFPRFLDLGASKDTGRQLGAIQSNSTGLPVNSFQVINGGQHAHNVSLDGNHDHAVSSDGNHTHAAVEAGQHSHANGPYDKLLTITGTATTACIDDDPTGTEPNILWCQPMVTTGNHTHSISANGQHAHSLSVAGSHLHTIDNQGDHSHTLAGGDGETRPINHALGGFIRVI